MSLIRRAKAMPSATLLVVQLAGVLLYPFMEDSRSGRAAFAVFGIAVLSLAVLAVRPTPAFTWVSIIFAAPAVVLLVLQLFSSATWLVPWSAGFEAVLYFYCAVGLIRYMFADHMAKDELVCRRRDLHSRRVGFRIRLRRRPGHLPGLLHRSTRPDEQRSWMELPFLSFTTMSSTGLSDVIPIRNFARAVVMLEQVAGVLYIAMVVSRMVGLTFMRRSAAAPHDG